MKSTLQTPPTTLSPSQHTSVTGINISYSWANKQIIWYTSSFPLSSPKLLSRSVKNLSVTQSTSYQWQAYTKVTVQWEQSSKGHHDSTVQFPYPLFFNP